METNAKTSHFEERYLVCFELEEGTRIAARPSGTEPKIKFYFSVNTKLDSADKFKETEAVLDQKIERTISEMDL